MEKLILTKADALIAEIEKKADDPAFTQKFMEIKRENIDKLLSLNDWQLKMIIQKMPTV